MTQYKYRKTFNPFTAFAEGCVVLFEKGQELYSDVKDVLEDRKIQYLSLTVSAINVLVSSDPVLATAKFTLKQQQMMFPRKKKGYIIDYSNVYWDPCPYHKCKTYRVKDHPDLVWCPLCMEFLVINN